MKQQMMKAHKPNEKDSKDLTNGEKIQKMTNLSKRTRRT